jgi:hypothetical protein
MSEPGVDPSSGKSSGDGMRPPERHPAYRRREPRLGSRAERENLAGDGKGKGTSGSNREAESTDASARGGLLRISKEAGVMPVERRGQVTHVGSEPTGNRRSSNSQRKAAAFEQARRCRREGRARLSRPEGRCGSERRYHLRLEDRSRALRRDAHHERWQRGPAA